MNEAGTEELGAVEPGATGATGAAAADGGGQAAGAEGEPAGTDARIVLYVREGCHLCDVAFEIVEQISLETGAQYIAVDIDYYPELKDRFHDDVPVLAVDGRLVAR
ncbi:MAG: glutaredoxin family protein, partial [bacterium]|nr:glutaredoxin family protein [bacterium]